MVTLTVECSKQTFRLRGRTMKVQKPVLTMQMVKDILEGVDYGTLTRDELSHALEVWGIEAIEEDSNEELIEYLKECLGK